MIGGAACLAAACFPGVAAAQVPIFPPPPGNPSTPTSPSASVLAPEGASTAFGSNPSRTGEVLDDRIFGPLGVAWVHQFGGGVDEPLVTGGRVIVDSLDDRRGDYGSRLTALSASSGKILWHQSIGSNHVDAPIAYSDGVVVLLARDGKIYGFRVDDGEPLWNMSLASGQGSTDEGGIVADAGTVYAFTGKHVYALDIATGQVGWTIASPTDGSSGTPAVDDSRVFIADDCGGAAALSRSDGSLIWSVAGELGCLSGTAIVAGGQVYSGNGRVYDAVSGSQPSRLPKGPGAVSGGLALVAGDPLRAFDPNTGSTVWTNNAGAFVDPRVVGPTTYTVSSDEDSVFHLFGIETETGRTLSNTEVPGPNFNHESELALNPGVAAGEGRVYVALAHTVTALAPRLSPPEGGVDLLFPKGRDYYAGSLFNWIAGVGADQRNAQPVIRLEAQEGSSHHWKTVAAKHAYVDGGVVLQATLDRNARYRATSDGLKPSPSVKLYAYPRFDFDIKRTSDTQGVINVRVSGINAKTLAAHKVYGYFGSAPKRKFSRLGGSRLRPTGKDSARGSVHFHLLDHVGVSDVIAVCVDGLAEAGYGKDVGLPGHCGARSVPYPPKKNRLARSPSSACARPAPAVRSRIAASSVACAAPAAR